MRCAPGKQSLQSRDSSPCSAIDRRKNRVRVQSKRALERLAQLQLSGAPGATNWHVLPLLPNITSPAPLVYRVPSMPQHPAGSQLATWGKFGAAETLPLDTLLLDSLLPCALVCATASDAVLARRTASTELTDFFIICSLGMNANRFVSAASIPRGLIHRFAF